MCTRRIDETVQSRICPTRKVQSATCPLGRRVANRQSGVVLAVVAVIALVIMGLSVAFLTISVTQTKDSILKEEYINALTIAEAGLERARVVLLAGHDDAWNDELRGPDGIGNTSDDGVLFGDAEGKVSFSSGTYQVRISNNADDPGGPFSDTDDLLIVNAVGTVRGSRAEARIETVVTFSSGTFTPQAAIVVGGGLNVAGNPTIQGTHGSVHANGDLRFAGSPTISQDATYGGSIKISGCPCIGGIVAQVPPAPIPSVNPADHRGLAQFIFGADGRIYDAEGALIFDGNGGGEWFSYKYEGSKTWAVSGNTPPLDGVMYFEGDLKISGNPGTRTSPWKITALVEGNVELSGNPAIQGFFQDVIFIVGRDLKISGNPDQYYEGLMAAHEQFNLSGNPLMNGVILAEDAEDLSNLVSASNYIDISGNINLTYNGGLVPFLRAGDDVVSIVAWHER